MFSFLPRNKTMLKIRKLILTNTFCFAILKTILMKPKKTFLVSRRWRILWCLRYSFSFWVNNKSVPILKFRLGPSFLGAPRWAWVCASVTNPSIPDSDTLLSRPNHGSHQSMCRQALVITHTLTLTLPHTQTHTHTHTPSHTHTHTYGFVSINLKVLVRKK